MFLSRFRAGGQGGMDRSPWGSFWFEPLGMRTSSGMRVTSLSAMRLAAVYSCVRVISESMAILPFRLYRKKPNGSRDLVTDHWLVTLLTRRPNAWQTPFEFIEMLTGHLCLRGNAFCQIVATGKGVITDLLPIHPDRIKVQMLENGSFNYVVKLADGSSQVFTRGEIWHIRGLSSDGIVGMNPMEVAAEVIGMGLSAQGYGARFFANDASPGGWIEYDGKFRDSDAKKSFREGWANAQSGKNRGKTAILEKGMKYHQLTLNNTDAQFLESRKYNRSEIAGLFRLPPHKIGDLDRSTFSNIEQQSLDFVNDCMLPCSERFESSIETYLLEDDSDLEIDYDFSKLLRGDMAARTAYYTGNINNGSLTRNEARISEGRNPIAGLDKPLMPLNMVTVDADGDVDQDDTPAAAAPINAPMPGRALALASASADRIARKETAMLLQMVSTSASKDQIQSAMSKHSDFVAQALGVDRSIADGYIELRMKDGMSTENREQDIYNAAFSKLSELALRGEL